VNQLCGTHIVATKSNNASKADELFVSFTVPAVVVSAARGPYSRKRVRKAGTEEISNTYSPSATFLAYLILLQTALTSSAALRYVNRNSSTASGIVAKV
jgi:hypothetical protein